MNSQALIITAYKDFELLKKLCLYCNEHFDCYIHIDKKSKIDKEVIKELNSIKNVYVYSKYNIIWGSYKHLAAINDLIHTAYQKGDYRYYHIMSANTIPLAPLDKIETFFENTEYDAFMERLDLSMENFGNRIKYFYFLHIFNKKTSSKISRFLQLKILGLQMKLHFDRKLDVKYKGYVYCHLGKKAVDYLENNKNRCRKYLNKIKYTYVCEEFYFQNLLSLDDADLKIKADALLFDDWSEDREYPSVLDERDFENLKMSDCLFARKFDSKKSKALLKMLDYQVE